MYLLDSGMEVTVLVFAFMVLVAGGPIRVTPRFLFRVGQADFHIITVWGNAKSVQDTNVSQFYGTFLKLVIVFDYH